MAAMTPAGGPGVAVSAGVLVHLKSFPSCDIWVEDCWIDAAMKPHRSTSPFRTREVIARAIAIGIRCGSFNPAGQPR